MCYEHERWRLVQLKMHLWKCQELASVAQLLERHAEFGNLDQEAMERAAKGGAAQEQQLLVAGRVGRRRKERHPRRRPNSLLRKIQITNTGNNTNLGVGWISAEEISDNGLSVRKM
jgi:hypothetical protein